MNLKRQILNSLLYYDKEIYKNWTQFSLEKFRAVIPLDTFEEKLLKFIESYLIKYKRPPSFDILGQSTDVFDATDLQNITHLKLEAPVYGVDFKYLLDSIFQQYFPNFLRRKIDANNGKSADEVSKELINAIIKFTPDFDSGILFLNELAKKEKDHYKERKDEVGILTGFDEIDLLTRGLKRGEVFVMGGFTSHGKSTFLMNVNYNAVINGYNTVFISLEMVEKQIEYSMYSLHSNSYVWAGSNVPLNYSKIRNVDFTSEEEDFYKNILLPDWETNPAYGKSIILKPSKPVTVTFLYQKLMEINMIFPVHVLVLDYVSKMVPEKIGAEKRHDVNSIIEGVKRLALNFNDGKGLPIFTAAQINRKSYIAYDENGGYDLTALGDYSSLEREADVVAMIYASPSMKQINESQFEIEKNRDGAIRPEPFRMYTNFLTKNMGSLVGI